jgi:hypothetical protein
MKPWKKGAIIGAIIGCIPVLWMLPVLIDIPETILYYILIITLPLSLIGALSGCIYETGIVRAWKKGVVLLTLPGAIVGLGTLVYLIYRNPRGSPFCLTYHSAICSRNGPTGPLHAKRSS